MQHSVRAITGAFGLSDLHGSLRRFLTVIGLAGLVILAAAVAVFVAEDAETKWMMAAIVVGLYASSALLPNLHLRKGRDRISYRFTEFPTMVAAAMGEPATVVIVAAAFVTFSLVKDWRNQPGKRERIPFNFGSWVIATAVMAAIASRLPHSYGFLVAVAVGMVVNDLLLARVINLFAGRPMLASLRDGWALRYALPMSSALAVTVLFLLPLPSLALFGIAPVVLMIGVWVALKFAFLLRERDHWKRMDTMGKDLVEQFDEAQIMETALMASMDMFGATATRIVVVGDDDSDDSVIYELTAREFDVTTRVVPTASLTGIERGEEDSEGLAVTVPLRRSSKPLGSMTIECPRYGGGPGRQMRFASAFGHTVANHLHIARSTRETQRQAEHHEHLATHDSLTGLGNRLMLGKRAPGLLARAAQQGLSCVMIVVDLDGFKNVNDTLGHEAGDQMLMEVSARLRAVMRQRPEGEDGADLIVRMGGDEFAILSVNHSTPEATAAAIATRLQRSLAQPVTVQGMMMNVDCCIGIAVQGKDGDDIATLLRKSDIAMYDAKKVGHGQYRYFDPASVRTNAADLTLASDMVRALSNREIICHFQPQVSLSTGKVMGFEALVRWDHPDRGLIYPDKFIPLVERTDQIHGLADEVLRRAAEAHKRLSGITGHDLTMSVNMSVRNLLDAALPDRIAAITREYGMDIRDLVIEITETAPVGDMPMVKNVVARLAQMGCTISLDDFGTGYSTLSAISAHSSVREVKIDRDFTMQMQTSQTAKVTIEAIVKIAATKNCRVVGEGVEDAETVALLSEIGCDIAQGYFISKPLPTAAIEDWLFDRYASAPSPATTLVAVAS